MANVVSVFDGMACGMIAMIEAGIKVDRYVAFEIDKYATKTSSHNFPMIEQRGDVFQADFTEFEGFDFLVGGSPCTYWSIAQTKNRETVASGLGWELFSQYVRALKEIKPKYFIYENNKSMSQAIRESISESFGFEPICINSALVSAQNRQRLYWVGIREEDGSYRKANIEQPEDMGILLKDVLDSNVYAMRDKGHAVISLAGRTTEREFFTKSQGNMVAEPIKMLSEKEMDYMVRDSKGKYTDRWSYLQKPDQNDKALCITANVHKGVPYNICAEPIPFNPTDDGKSHTLTSTYYKISGVPISEFGEEKARQRIAIPVCIAQRGRYDEDGNVYQHYEANDTGKTNVLTTVQKDNMIAEPLQSNLEQIKELCANSEHIKECCDNIAGILKLTPTRVGALPRPNGELSKSQAFQIYSQEGKSVTLCANGGGAGGKTGLYVVPLPTDEDGNIIIVDGPIKETVYKVENGLITVKGRQYPIKLNDGYYIIRKLTVSECMRLQTVPEWYEFPVSNSQAYKMLGNGWTINVIKWLLLNLD